MRQKLTGHTDTVSCLDVAESRKQLFSGSTDGSVRIWSWEQDFACVHTVNAPGPVETILVFDDWLFAGTQPTGGREGVVKVWHMGNGFEQTLEGHRGAVFALAQGGAYLFSAGDDTGVKTWQFNESSFVPVIELSGHTAPVQALKVCGNVLLSADRGGMVSMWDLQSGQQSGSITTNHTAPLMGLWVEESHLFTAALDGHVKTWDAAGAMLYDHLVTNQHNQPSGVTSLAVVSDAAADGDPNNQGEPVLVTACDDNALKMWRMPTFDKRGILASRVGHSDVVRCIAKGPGNSFFTGGMDRTIFVWEFTAD